VQDDWHVGGTSIHRSRCGTVSGTVGHMVVAVGALVVVLVIVGGVLMAALLTTAADRSDVWDRYTWPRDGSSPRPKQNDGP